MGKKPPNECPTCGAPASENWSPPIYGCKEGDSYKGLTQKSESRLGILVRGLLAAVDLRKAQGVGRGSYPRPQKDRYSGRMHQDLTHLLPEQYRSTHRMEVSWSPSMPQHVSAKVTYHHPSYGTSEALGFTSHGGSKEWYEGSGAASQHSKAHEIQPHADAAFGRFLKSKMMAPHHPDRE
ncbi:MAG: hypothetical protein E6Q97_21250 [Desulfurellales bacterium]|nr:MAG: hypothetical protein E6Q97_21250 [Desulfurellales bacterium]